MMRGPSIFGLFGFFSLFPLLVIASSLWVYFDARSLGVRKGLAPDLGGIFDMTPLGWFLSCLILWIVAFPIYLGMRTRYKRIALAEMTPPPEVSQPAAASATTTAPAAALTVCRACGRPVPENFQVCPYCRARIPTRQPFNLLPVLLVILGILAVITLAR
jgi:hypothetical protein